jgi:FSR family fosmidomycin resistance protein-like MFS transporter
MGGLGAAVLGTLADHTSIDFVYKVCAFLPALGLFTALLPDTNSPDKGWESKAAVELGVALGMGSDEQPV